MTSNHVWKEIVRLCAAEGLSGEACIWDIASAYKHAWVICELEFGVFGNATPTPPTPAPLLCCPGV